MQVRAFERYIPLTLSNYSSFYEWDFCIFHTQTSLRIC